MRTRLEAAGYSKSSPWGHTGNSFASARTRKHDLCFQGSPVLGNIGLKTPRDRYRIISHVLMRQDPKEGDLTSGPSQVIVSFAPRSPHAWSLSSIDRRTRRAQKKLGTSCSGLDHLNSLGGAYQDHYTCTPSALQKDRAHHNAPRFQHLHHPSQAMRRDKLQASANMQPRSWCRMKVRERAEATLRILLMTCRSHAPTSRLVQHLQLVGRRGASLEPGTCTT